jgi:2'-5' RNA ligase
MARDRAARPEAASRRLFVAVEVPAEAQRALDEAIAPWREALDGARWSPPENRHVTVTFLGPVWPRLVDRVQEAVAQVAAAASPFDVALAGLGRFPERGKARVLWAGLDDPAGGLASLAAAVDRALAPDFGPETRPYHPHLTLARSNPPLTVPPAWEETPIEPATWRVDRVVLFESHLRRPHAWYEVVADSRLSRQRPR